MAVEGERKIFIPRNVVDLKNCVAIQNPCGNENEEENEKVPDKVPRNSTHGKMRDTGKACKEEMNGKPTKSKHTV